MIRLPRTSRLAALCVGALATAGLGIALAPPSNASGIYGPDCVALPATGQTQCTFSGDGSIAQSWRVPSGVTSVRFQVNGSSGGGYATNQQGGHGAQVAATMAVTPGQVLGIFWSVQGGVGGYGGQGSDAWGGGMGGGRFGGSGQGYGGGGYSAVMTGTSGPYHPFLLAGGGGGQGGGVSGTGGAGGDAGIVAGNGASALYGGDAVAAGGGGGSMSAGGAGGDYVSPYSSQDCGVGNGDGHVGSSFQGGHGASADCAGGGGGGGGYFGGGGGGAYYDGGDGNLGAGGGAGSSYVDSTNSVISDYSITTLKTRGAGSVVATFPAVPLSSQTISFTAPDTGVVGGDFTPAPTATSGLPVTVTVDDSSTLGACSLDSGVVHFLGSGNCVLNADQPGDSHYLRAAQVQQTITIGYGFGGFLDPLPPGGAVKSGSTIPVKFTLQGDDGPLSAAASAALASSGQVWASLTGPGASGPTVLSQPCGWDATGNNFQCNLKTPKRLQQSNGGATYSIHAQTLAGDGSLVDADGQDNPMAVWFK